MKFLWALLLVVGYIDRSIATDHSPKFRLPSPPKPSGEFSSDECYQFDVANSALPLRHPKNIQGGAIACKEKCRSTFGCKYFTWRRKSMHNAECILQETKGNQIRSIGSVSGTVEGACGRLATIANENNSEDDLSPSGGSKLKVDECKDGMGCQWIPKATCNFTWSKRHCPVKCGSCEKKNTTENVFGCSNKYVALRDTRGRYVVAHGHHGHRSINDGPLTVNETNLVDGAVFDVSNLGEDDGIIKVGLRSIYGNWLVAYPGPTYEIKADSYNCLMLHDSEMFQVGHDSKGAYWLKTAYGRYVGSASDGILMADAEHVSQWEKFYPVCNLTPPQGVISSQPGPVFETEEGVRCE